jgi:hypothetical protein
VENAKSVMQAITKFTILIATFSLLIHLLKEAKAMPQKATTFISIKTMI